MVFLIGGLYRQVWSVVQYYLCSVYSSVVIQYPTGVPQFASPFPGTGGFIAPQPLTTPPHVRMVKDRV